MVAAIQELPCTRRRCVPERDIDHQADKTEFAEGGQATASCSLPHLEQDIVICFDWFEVGLLAEHAPHLDLNFPRDK